MRTLDDPALRARAHPAAAAPARPRHVIHLRRALLASQPLQAFASILAQIMPAMRDLVRSRVRAAKFVRPCCAVVASSPCESVGSLWKGAFADSQYNRLFSCRMDGSTRRGANFAGPALCAPWSTSCIDSAGIAGYEPECSARVARGVETQRTPRAKRLADCAVRLRRRQTCAGTANVLCAGLAGAPLGLELRVRPPYERNPKPSRRLASGGRFRRIFRADWRPPRRFGPWMRFDGVGARRRRPARHRSGPRMEAYIGPASST
jgi:hypothetical protein